MKILKNFSNYIKESQDTPTDENNDMGESQNSEQLDKDSTEEEGQYIGISLLKELADALNSEVVDNCVEYNGKKICFFSETEKFHVDKKKFDTVEDVVRYLKSNTETN